MDERKTEFRDYLESSGVIGALTTVFLKLIDEPVKPVNAIAYLVQNLSELNTDGKLEAHFHTLQNSDKCQSLLKKHLTREILEELKTKTTLFGSTLYDCIRSGLENLDSSIGIYAADAECYDTFGAIFNPIINDYHGEFTDEMNHPPTDYGKPESFGDLDPDKKYIVSLRIRCGRSIDGFPLNPKMSELEYVQLMGQIREVLESMDDDFKGTFHVLNETDDEVKQQLIADHYLFKDDDRFLRSAGALEHWPMGRAIYLNESKTFIVWVNEEDHLRIISMQPGGDLGEVYGRFVKALEFLTERLQFLHHTRFGWLTFCPTNLGTAIRASVHIKLPKLSQDLEKLNSIAAEFNLQVRGTHGEHTESEDGIFDISNKRRLGITEAAAIQEMFDGISKIIAMENE